MPLPIVIAIVLGITVEIVGRSLEWSNGAIGSICLLIIGGAVLWNEELLHRERLRSGR